MLIKSFLILLFVMLTCCTSDSLVINLTFSEPLQFSHTTIRNTDVNPVKLENIKNGNTIEQHLLEKQRSARAWPGQNVIKLFMAVIYECS